MAKEKDEELAAQLLKRFEEEARGVADSLYALKKGLIEQLEEPRRPAVEEPRPLPLKVVPEPPLPPPIVLIGEWYYAITPQLEELEGVTNLHIRCLVPLR
jgi:hypothetical protein